MLLKSWRKFGSGLGSHCGCLWSSVDSCNCDCTEFAFPLVFYILIQDTHRVFTSKYSFPFCTQAIFISIFRSFPCAKSWALHHIALHTEVNCGASLHVCCQQMHMQVQNRVPKARFKILSLVANRLFFFHKGVVIK